ncbi:ABC transporter permease subunit [Streptomyces sp. NPDC057253]|uniref:ABC transporter permease subunit n=1 Tax=Streptomyces sp. NPDC057253 TaxID=3346069 RepID=UPI003640FCDF
MIWLTWRQFRVQALTAAGALAAIAIYIVILGMQIRSSYDSDVAGCTSNCSSARQHFLGQYESQVILVSVVLVVVPAIIGIFWGAPLITREVETGTHRLVWNQSVTRNRWLTVKLAFIGLASAALIGLLSLLLTWAASPYDEVEGNRFGALSFISRNITPIGYALFAFVLATAIGLLVRRTMPAMAITLGVLAAIQIVVPFAVRPHIQPPVKETVAMSGDISQSPSINIGSSGVNVVDFAIPGAWVLDSENELLDAQGKQVTESEISDCSSGSNYAEEVACMGKKNLHFNVSYQPADRYWTFQWIELAGYLVLAGLLALFCLKRIRHPLI